MSFKNIFPKDYSFSTNVEDPRMISRLTEDYDQAQIFLQGYSDDEGIKLNGGRVGARLAPVEIRKCFYKMTSGFLPEFKIFDGGNIVTEIPLEQRHEAAQQNVELAYASGKFVMTLGGGHDYGYPDAQGFLNHFKNSKLKPIVINFDAHLDVRPLDQGLTSGTPFYRLLSQNEGAFHFLEVGIQPFCNSANQLAWCEKQGGKIITMKQIECNGMLAEIKKSLGKYKGHPVMISVDIDAFSSAFAPGCSQSWPNGFTPQDFFKAFDYLFQQLNVKGIGIYEVSPPLDVQPLTSRLAALILYRCLELKKIELQREETAELGLKKTAQTKTPSSRGQNAKRTTRIRKR